MIFSLIVIWNDATKAFVVQNSKKKEKKQENIPEKIT